MKIKQIISVVLVMVFVCMGTYTAISETPCTHATRKVEQVSSATCSKGSVEREVCQDCGAQLDTWTNDDKLGHNWKTENVSAATCTEGSVEREVCVRCGEVNDQWKNNDALGHSWKTELVSAATCTEGSVEREVCVRCGEVNDQWKNNDALGHSWKTELVSAATCTEGSVEREVCVRCGEVNDQWKNDDKLGHIWKNEIVSEATCTSGSIEREVCSRCGTINRQWTNTNAKGHKPGSAATCISPQLCLVCKAVLVPAQGHTPGAPAACEKPQLCKVCRVVLANALQHSYKRLVIAPTEKERGYTKYTCSLCGHVYYGNYTKALGTPEQGISDILLLDEAGNAVPYITSEVNEPMSAGAVEKRILRVTVNTNDLVKNLGVTNLVLSKSDIVSLLADGYEGICLHLGEVEIDIPLEIFNTDILADILADQNASDENAQYIIRVGQKENEGVVNALTLACHIDILLSVNGSELDIGSILDGMKIKLLDTRADSTQTDTDLFYQPTLLGQSSSAEPIQVTRIDGGWEAPILGSGVYAIIEK